MFATGNARLGALAGFAVAALLVGGLHACATAPAGSPAPHSVSVVSDLSVERDGESTVVALLGVSDPIFTAFRGNEPKRVVVDLASVRPGQGAQSVSVYDGLVEEVSVAEFSSGSGEPTTRVEISLADEADFDVIPEANRLEVRITPASDGADPGQSPEISNAAGSGASAASGQETQGAASESVATRLLSIETEPAGEGALVRLRTDGALAGVESFTLADPVRLVIDLPDLTNAAETSPLEVGGPQVSRIRVGQHPDKVRIVVDAVDPVEGFSGRHLQPVSDGLVIALGSGEAVDWALAAVDRVASETTDEMGTADESAPQVAETDDSTEAEPTVVADAESEAPALADAEVEPVPAAIAEADSMVVADAESEATLAAAEPVAESPAGELEAADSNADAALAQVYGVQYEPQETRDRVVVVGDQPIDYQLLSPDAETLVVSLRGAAIDPKAAVRIAPDPGAPISLVSAFAQPDVSEPEVRVVVKRAAGLVPTVTREGTMLILDFARAGAVAETPPVLAEPAASVAAPVGPTTTPTLASAPAAIAPAAQALPAALDPDDPTQILEEGGLLDGKQYVGRRISLDFKDVDTQDVLRLIADVSDLNIIAGDEVKGQVTIRLVDVPWDQALDVILLTKGLGFVRVGNVLRIAPGEMLKQEEEARLQERRAKEKLEDLVVKLQPVNYADVKEVSTMVKRLLTARGSVDVDARTNTVIIKDIPSVIDESTALIKAIDTQTPQVMIEAKVVEANLDFSREIGSEWGFGSQPDEDQDDFTISSRTQDAQVITALDSPFPFDQANNVVISNPITSLANGVLNLGAFLLDDRFDVTLRLAAAEANGEGKVISSPRVVTLDNREALIEQGVAIPFQTFENGDAQLEFIDAVLSLKVTPHITADRSIIMKIAVSRNAPDDSVQTPTGSPAIAKNQAKTETLVRDGQTLVIGGIYVVDKSESQSRVPYLHSVPVLGRMFRNQSLRDIRKELLIFVTPRVVVGPELAS